MRKILIAVCDTDGSYGEKLGEWFSLQRGEKLQSMFFSTPESFWEYHGSKKPDIVLLGTGFLDDPAICEEIMGQRKRVQEESPKGGKDEILWMYLRTLDSKEPIPAYIRDLPAVDKYQPASRILREIFTVYQQWENETLNEVSEEREVIGIYSPCHSIWQTPFALTFAQGLAQEEKVLYVNLQECAGFGGWFGEEYEKDLLDVMYLCLNDGGNIAHCVGSALYTMEGVDYIPPAKDGGCLGEISAEDYLKFVKLLAEHSGYRVILLDFGMMVPGFFQLLEVCSKVYIVTEAEELCKASLQQFRQMAERQENINLQQRLVYLSLPSAETGHCPGEGKLKQWLWGAIGDFSRRLVGVQGGTD